MAVEEPGVRRDRSPGGIYGLTTYAVARRTQEIGIRMALGANAAQVLRTVLGSFAPAIAAGIVIGLFSAWAATGLLAHWLFGIAPTDPLTLAAVSALLTTVALLACYLPARRALRVDPVVALRAE
jgi:putative ABC transport system permease protein